MGDLHFLVEGHWRPLATLVFFFQEGGVICFRYLHTKAFKVTGRVRLYRVRSNSGLVDLLRMFLHLTTDARGRVGASGDVQRRFLGLFRLQYRGDNVVAAARRFRRLVTAKLRQGVGVERGAAQAKCRLGGFIYRRV